MQEYVPPQAVEVEKHVLGAMMLSPDAAEHACTVMSGEDFFLGSHQAIFEAVALLSREGRATDVLSVSQELRRTGKIGDAGGEPKLLEISAEVVSSSSIQEHARIVRDKAVKRKQIVVAQRLLSSALSEGAPLDTQRQAEAELAAAALSIQQAGELRPIREVVIESLHAIERRRKGEIVGLSTGIECLDRHLGGMQNDDLIVLGARPSNGKTSLSAQIGLFNAEKGKKVAFFELEMSDRAVVDRALFARAGINQQQFRRDGYPQHGAAPLTRAATELADFPFFIDGQAGITPSQIGARCRRLRREQGGLDLVIVDNIQRMGSDLRVTSKREQAADASRALKELAKELHVPVLGISHIRRLSDGDGSEPTLSDLQESGNIEQDADIVFLLHNEGLYREMPSHEEGLTKLICAKFREGELGVMRLYFEKTLTTFLDWNNKPNNFRVEDWDRDR